MKYLFVVIATLISAATGASLLNAAPASAANGTIWHVNQESESPGDGRSWKSAFRSLQDALSAATNGDEIWVAQGIYYPDSIDVKKSFALKEDVAVFGGFKGSETTRAQRDFRHNVTTLSGNIGKGDKTRNTETIILGADRAILDGFTISDAYGVGKPVMHLVPADILKSDTVAGGGMRNFMTSPIVRNSIFKDNYSPKGGAVYNVHKPGADQATFINVDFINNIGEMRGGAVSNDLGAMPVFLNSRFRNNRSLDKGGAMYNDFAASPLLFNCEIIGNFAVSAGGMGNDGGSAPLMVNVTIVDNNASSGMGADLYQGTGANSNPILINSVIDEIYNWHEDVVSELGSAVPSGQTVPLKKFLTMSNLKGQLDPTELESAPAYNAGYQADLDGAVLLKNPLIEKLVQFYAKNKGAIQYHGEYTRPRVSQRSVSASVLFVTPSSESKVKDGLSWETALTDLQEAIDLASVSGASVWLKAGTYRPAKQEDKIAAFILYDNVKLYGGFSGTESAMEQRRTSGNRSILSAEVAASKYRYPHVLYGANNTVLDSLIVRDGNATGFTYQGKGGGLLAYHAGKTFLPRDDAVGFAMTIHNCIFEMNTALEGGAIYAFGKAKLNVTDTSFVRNHAVYGGAVIEREGTTSTYMRSSFNANDAAIDGGAIYADYGSHLTINQSRFKKNSAGEHGGAIYEISRASQLEGTVVTVGQSDFSDNEAKVGASVYNLDASTLTIGASKYPPNSIVSPASTVK